MECEAKGGDRVCKEAKLVGEGFRFFAPLFPWDAEKWFASIDAGVADAMKRTTACRWQETTRSEWGRTEDGDGIDVPITMVTVDMWTGPECEKDDPGGVLLFPDKLYACDAGSAFRRSPENKYCFGPKKEDRDRQKGAPNSCEGNPCNVATGNKFQSETDYTAPNAGGLTFTRSYNTFSGTWSNTYDRSISRQVVATLGTRAVVTAARPDGKVVRFQEISDDIYVPPRDVSDTLIALRDANRNIIGWQLRTDSDSIESYGPDGRLRTITSRVGLTQTLAYETVAGKTVLKSVKDAFGRLLLFKNDASGRLQTMTDPAGNVFTYGYDTSGRLATVTYPGVKVRTYHYNEPAMTGGANLPFALTGITDENNVRYATWKYDAAGNAVLSEHAGGVERVSLAYRVDSDEVRRTEVTDASGHTRTYNLALINGIFKVTGLNETCDTCTDDAQVREYDDNGNLTRRVDRTGVETSWTYDLERNLELTRLDNFSKLTTTEWHNDFRLPTKITVGARETELEYDPTYGTLLRKTITDTANQISRTWRFTYFDSTRLLKKIDGPRTDISDETNFEYDAQGNLASATNALGHTTRFALYDNNGRVGSITDPNGLVTLITYDGRGRTKTRKIGQELTTFGYDNVGQLTSVTLPSSEVITYIYDGAHRLTDIKNSAGERKHFTLDAFGNEKKVEYFDSSGNVTFSNSAEFDRYNRLRKSITSAGHETTFDVDENGDVRSITDALMRETRFRRENRLLQEVTHPDQSSIKYAYDELDRLRVVTNANDVPVLYTLNALGDVESIDTRDPDAFVSFRNVDQAGNLESKTDFRGIETTFTYDALNRIKTMSAPAATTITFGYDAGANAKGLLTSIVDESGTTTRTYNAQSRIETVTRVFGGLAIKLRYDYDSAGRLNKLTYPSGRIVTYKYEKEKIVGIDVGTEVLMSQAKYTPFAGVRAWRWGNGKDYLRSTDLDGRIAKYSLGNSERTITYDGAGNIKEVLDSLDAKLNQRFAYDDVDRVTDYFSGASFALEEHYDYDFAGNRKSATIAGKAYLYTYTEGTDFLAAVAGPVPKKWQRDATGSVLSDGTQTFKLDSYRSVGSVTKGAVRVDYLRNGFRQRVTKRSTDGTSTHFVFDENGHLLAELDKAGNSVVEHIWLGEQPVGVLVGGVVNYVFSDHLNTPRLITDTSSRPRWSWRSNPFGSTLPIDNPAGLGKFTYGPRFPGQYYDGESGLHYNYHRDYDPQTGRYVQSDPIGLNGGINTFDYVGGNPLSYSDPQGLAGKKYTTEPVPVTPDLLSSLNLLQRLANDAADNVDLNCGVKCALPWIRGTLIHSEFARLVKAQCDPMMYKTEVSYLNGNQVPYGTPNSSRADVVFGPLDAPTAVYDLKTGWAYISRGQLNGYGDNLPPGSVIKVIRPSGG
jgi:RHS repeat-associated protein